MHPLAASVEQGGGLAADCERAQKDAEAVEQLVVEVCAVTTASPEMREALTTLVRAVEARVSPWRAVYPHEPLVGWHETVRARLHRHAVRLFGASAHLVAPPPTERLSGPVSGRMGGPPSLFGL